MTKQEFADIMRRAKRIYNEPWFLPTSETVEAWYKIMGELDKDKLEEAMDLYIRNNTAVPTPAGIMAYYREIEEAWKPLKRDIMDKWALVKSVYERHGGKVEHGTLRELYETKIRQYPREEQFKVLCDWCDELRKYAEENAENLPTMAEYIRGTR